MTIVCRSLVGSSRFDVWPGGGSIAGIWSGLVVAAMLRVHFNQRGVVLKRFHTPVLRSDEQAKFEPTRS